MAYIAIRTKYLGPTTYRGARIKATLDDRERGYGFQLINPYDDELDTTWGDGWENHKKAAHELAEKFFNWHVQHDEPIKLIGGASKDGYVWVRFANNQVGEVI